jgi:hypothetical protein
MKNFVTPLLLTFLSFGLSAQTVPAQPKLVVGVVVDQMSYEFFISIYRSV